MTASREELRKMQESLLKAILLGQPLQGTMNSVTMPDLHFVTAGGSILLLDENLHGPISIASAERPLQVVGRSMLPAPAGPTGHSAFLRFAPSEVGANSVRMTLEARMLPSATGTDLGLSNVQIEFTKVGNEWVAGGPTFSAV